MDTANKQIEQQITVLLRRVQRIHLSTTTGDVNLERSAYGIMCKLADEGPQRLGALATAFGLDPSTITRQVQALEEIGLAGRKTDPSDRRASILDLTDNGREVLDSTRAHRRAGSSRPSPTGPSPTSPTSAASSRSSTPPSTASSSRKADPVPSSRGKVPVELGAKFRSSRG